jgi:hypothetical protein
MYLHVLYWFWHKAQRSGLVITKMSEALGDPVLAKHCCRIGATYTAGPHVLLGSQQEQSVLSASGK